MRCWDTWTRQWWRSGWRRRRRRPWWLTSGATWSTTWARWAGWGAGQALLGWGGVGAGGRGAAALVGRDAHEPGQGGGLCVFGGVSEARGGCCPLPHPHPPPTALCRRARTSGGRAEACTRRGARGRAGRSWCARSARTSSSSSSSPLLPCQTAGSGSSLQTSRCTWSGRSRGRGAGLTPSEQQQQQPCRAAEQQQRAATQAAVCVHAPRSQAEPGPAVATLLGIVALLLRQRCNPHAAGTGFELYTRTIKYGKRWYLSDVTGGG